MPDLSLDDATARRSGRRCDENDDDDVDEAGDDEPEDDAGDGHNSVGAHTRRSLASSQTVGRSSSTYLNSGANTNQIPKPAPMGAAAGSYDPKARSASALKSQVDGFKDKVQSRCDKYMAKNPGASRKETMASKSARRAYKAWRKAN